MINPNSNNSNSFGLAPTTTMDNNNNNRNNGFLPFNKVDPFGRFRTANNNTNSAMAALGMSNVNPFPTSNNVNHRGGLISGNSFTSSSATTSNAASPFGGVGMNAAGIQQSLNMLCDVAVAGEPGSATTSINNSHKRFALGEAPRPLDSAFKRRRTSQQAAATPPMQNPKLLERLSSLGGGFPMPKWAGVGGGKNKEKSQRSHQAQLQLKPSLGSFPMPGIQNQKHSQIGRLDGYDALWNQHAPAAASSNTNDYELQKEILARQFCKSNTRIVDGRLRHGNL